MSNQDPRELRQIVKDLKSSGMQCNCDLDNWQPEQSTGHSHVCRIHKAAIEAKFYPRFTQALKA